MLRFVAALLAGFSLTVAALAPAPAAVGAATGCAPVEARAWMTPAGSSFNDYQGIDVGTCLPLGLVSGTEDFQLNLGLRHNPVVLDQVRVYVADAAHDGGVLGYDSGTGHAFITGVANDNRTASITIPVNVGILGGGWKELRFQARVHSSLVPAGQLSFVTTGWQVHVAGADTTYRPLPWTEGRSWWGTNGPYVHFRFRSPLPAGPISGVWTFAIDSPDGPPQVTVGTDSHADPMVIGPSVPCSSSSCRLDTTTLPNGPTWLFLRADHAVAGGINSAVELIYFTVANGGASGAPPPSASPVATPTPTAPPTPAPTPAPTPSASVCGG